MTLSRKLLKIHKKSTGVQKSFLLSFHNRKTNNFAKICKKLQNESTICGLMTCCRKLSHKTSSQKLYQRTKKNYCRSEVHFSDEYAGDNLPNIFHRINCKNTPTQNEAIRSIPCLFI